MKKINLKIQVILLIAVLFFPLFSVLASAQKVYLLNMKYLNNELSLSDVVIRNSSIDNIDRDGEFRYELISLQNDILESGNFKVDKPLNAKSFNMQTTLGSSKIENDKPILLVLKVKYHKNGKLINIYSNENDKKILEINVSSFINTCGDAICQDNENYFNCKTDCVKKDSGFDVGNVDNNQDDKVINKQKNNLLLIIFVMGAVMLLSIVFIVFGIKYLNKNKY